METPGCENLQLISFHSTSKGLIGECGRRGGMMELHNIDPYVHTQLYKLASSGLCSGVDGQMMMSLMVRPPLPDEESYELFNKEETDIFESLKRRAVSVSGLVMMKLSFMRCILITKLTLDIFSFHSTMFHVFWMTDRERFERH